MTPPPPSATADDLAIIPAIDGQGGLYPIGKLDAHRRGQLHQAVSVFVFDGPDLLIQQRAAGKYHSGGLWANTCCTHPHWGESGADAARRRLAEELGLRDVALVAARGLTYAAAVARDLMENERVQAFRGEADRRTLTLSPDPSEVSAVRWVALAELHRELAATPDRFAPWFRIYLARWVELGLDA